MKKRVFSGILFILLLSAALNACSRDNVAQASDNYRNYYEIFVRSFYDSDGDGIGDLKGVTSRLGYIKDLGADGIWLMPIMPSPSYHKYDVTDYYTIDPEYGTLEDFDELLREAHQQDIKVIIDLVVNHSSDKIHWFTEAVRGLWDEKENEYTEFYNFTKEYSGSGFTQITDKYYYESRFVAGMPDLNLDSEKVRDEIQKITSFWLDRGVDGFRLDAVTSYYTGNDTKNIDFMKWLNTSVKEYKPDAYIVGEAWTNQAVIRDYYESGMDSFFNFPFSQAEGALVKSLNSMAGENLAGDMKKWNDTIDETNEKAIDAVFLSNHDNARSAGFLLRNLLKQKMAASVYLLLPGNPFIYYGEEIGMTGSGNDPNKRLPMLWSSTSSEGITNPPPGATQTIGDLPGVEEHLKDPNSLLNFYKAVLSAKKRFPEIARGEISLVKTGKTELCAYSMTLNESMVTIIHNLGESAQTIELEPLQLKRVKIRASLRSDPQTAEPIIKKGELTIPPYSTIILK